MNFRSFRFTLSAAAAFAALAFASAPAVAQTATCSGCTTSPTPTPAPAVTSFQLGGAFGGLAEAAASNGGPTRTSSVGGLTLDTVFSGTSNGCVTGCGQATFNFGGRVFQNTLSEAMSQGPGSSAAQTLGNGAVLLTIGR